MTPKIIQMDVYPVAGRDSMLLNLSGAHAPFFTRNIVILTDDTGATGLGEVPGGQKITAAENGLAVPLGNDNASKTAQQKFLEAINQLIQKVDGGAQALFMNAFVLSRLTTIAREFIQWQPNTFGMLVPYYNGVPLRDAGYDKTGDLVIPNDETVGNNNDCTSVYAVRFGEAGDLSIATNVGVEVKDLGLVGVHYTHSVEFDADLVLLNDLAVARLEGIEVV